MASVPFCSPWGFGGCTISISFPHLMPPPIAVHPAMTSSLSDSSACPASSPALPHLPVSDALSGAPDPMFPEHCAFLQPSASHALGLSYQLSLWGPQKPMGCHLPWNTLLTHNGPPSQSSPGTRLAIHTPCWMFPSSYPRTPGSPGGGVNINSV